MMTRGKKPKYERVHLTFTDPRDNKVKEVIIKTNQELSNGMLLFFDNLWLQIKAQGDTKALDPPYFALAEKPKSISVKTAVGQLFSQRGFPKIRVEKRIKT